MGYELGKSAVQEAIEKHNREVSNIENLEPEIKDELLRIRLSEAVREDFERYRFIRDRKRDFFEARWADSVSSSGEFIKYLFLLFGGGSLALVTLVVRAAELSQSLLQHILTTAFWLALGLLFPLVCAAVRYLSVRGWVLGNEGNPNLARRLNSWGMWAAAASIPYFCLCLAYFSYFLPEDVSDQIGEVEVNSDLATDVGATVPVDPYSVDHFQPSMTPQAAPKASPRP